MAARHQAKKISSMKALLVQTRKYVEESKCSIIVIRLNNKTKQVDISGDLVSVNSVKSNMILVNDLQHILENGEDESDMKFVDTQKVVDTLDKLPQLKYRLSTEGKEMLGDTGGLRKSFTAMMKSQGYGRNSPLRYGEGKPPAWWDEELVTWDTNLNGVNAPTNWKSLNKGPWTKVIFQQIKNCYEYDMTTNIAGDEIDDDFGDLSHEDIHDDAENHDEEIHEEEIHNIEIHEDIHDIDFLDDLDFSINESFSAFDDFISEDQSVFHEPNDNVQKKKSGNKLFTQQTISKCNHCGRMFISKQLLIDHMQTVHKDQPVVLPDIETRKRKLQDADNDEQHKKRKSPKVNDQIEFKCFCGKPYKKEAWLKKHIVNVHNQNKT
jgi:hypothetical protein